MTNAPEVRLRADDRPLYMQAVDALRNLLQHGEYVAGDRLPSEPRLAERLGISRPTLREALQTLEEEGAIVRRHGVGTFVAEQRPVLDAGLEVLESIERMASRGGLHVDMGEVVIAERMTTEDETCGLGLSEPEPAVSVTRVILAEGKPVAHLTDALPQRLLRQADLGPGFHGSVLDTLVARGWPALSHSRTELLSEAASQELAHALRVQRGAPLMKLVAQLYATDGQVVDYSISYFVPGSFRFHVVRRIAGA
ncbi:MAG: GntR family transcriptional regulator [Anaerolineae bacterium]|jgi:GntR family transcriptional regulator|nr:GntR family transcriptional regulator [Anaerolineae bacterium]